MRTVNWPSGLHDLSGVKLPFDKRCGECVFEAWERMTYGGVEVVFLKRIENILKDVWVDAVSEWINASN